MAPLGQAPAQSPQPVHLLVSMTLFSVSVAPVGQSDVEAEAILGTQAQVAHRHALHAEALPSIFSNFHAGTLQTGQSWGGSLPT